MLKCSICKEDKVPELFDFNKHNKSGKETRCKECRSTLWEKRYYSNIEKSREQCRVANSKYKQAHKLYTRKSYVKKMYGTTVEILGLFVNNYLAQNGAVCAICGKIANVVGEVKQKDKRRLVVDHCHKTGKLRGMLCDICNTALGKFEDDVELLEKAINYLKKS